MPLREPERLPTIIRMRVINPRARRAGDTGWIVDTAHAPRSELIYIALQFEPDGRPEMYERTELELVQL